MSTTAPADVRPAPGDIGTPRITARIPRADPRVPRRVHPAVTPAPVVLPAPPCLPEASTAQSMTQSLLMSAGMLGGMVFLVINPIPLFIFAGGLFLLGAVGMGVGWVTTQRTAARRALRKARERYVADLDAARSRIQGLARAQHDSSWQNHPAPEALSTIALSDRVFERRRGDADFLHVRVGRGEVAAHAAPRVADATTGDPDAVSVRIAHELCASAQTVPDLPVTLALADSRLVSVVGARADSLDLIRSMLVQAACWHAPRDLALLVAAEPSCAHAWDWTKWLPHQLAGPAIVTDAERLDETLVGEILTRFHAEPASARPEPARPRHLLVVVDGLTLQREGALGLLAQVPASGVTVVIRSEQGQPPPWADATVALDLDGALVATGRPTPAGGSDAEPAPLTPPVDARTDRLSAVGAATIAKLLGRAARQVSDVGVETKDLGEESILLEIARQATRDRDSGWAGRTGRALLRVPLGRGSGGNVVELDLKEAAAGGMGPHGVIIGATGSGKSELLRTLVIGLALTHPPEQLSFVLADFKGGAAFAGLGALPHVAGVITNLADDEASVERMYQALFGELQRRQDVLRAAGNLTSVAVYQRRRQQDPSLKALPYLVVVVDEFSELLVARPDFADLFAAAGRLGRSLGMHLVLASQRLDEGRIRGLESHLSYRIALRTFSGPDSSAVIGVPDAYHLPQQPGWALLKVGSEPMTRFRATSVSTPLPTDGRPTREERPRPRRFTAAMLGAPDPIVAVEEPSAAPLTDEDDAPNASKSVLRMSLSALTDDTRRTHQIWLPPLPAAVDLGVLLPDLAEDGGKGLTASWAGAGTLIVPMGIVDLPRQQRYDGLMLGLSGDKGNVAMCGGPQTGKSTFLATFLLSLAVTHTPDQAHVYCLDYGGGLADLAGLPHVGAVISRADHERSSRLIAFLLDLISERERDRHDDTDAEPRAGASGADRGAEVFLCVDSMADLRAERPDFEDAIAQIANRGLSVGVHVLITASRWADIKPSIRDSLGNRIELRLNEPADSLVDRPAARTIPAGAPGRGIVEGGMFVQYALPILRHGGEVLGTRAAVERIRAAWHGACAPPVRMLPRLLVFDALPTPGTDELPGVPLGVTEADLLPAYVDLTGVEPNLLILGDARSGKTNLLRLALAGLLGRATPDNTRIAVVDYRRGLLDAVDERFLHGYAGSAPAASAVVDDLATLLTHRLPGADLTASQLRSRSWWSGPEVYLVVDDYDLVDNGFGNPLDQLVEFLPVAGDIGLHVLLARRSGGASRALMMPLMQRLRDFGAVSVLLSGDPSEGPLVSGVRARPQPVGRGLLLRHREQPALLQTALIPVTDPEAAGLSPHWNTRSPRKSPATRTDAEES